jgi:hypothetical protein
MHHANDRMRCAAITFAQPPGARDGNRDADRCLSGGDGGGGNSGDGGGRRRGSGASSGGGGGGGGSASTREATARPVSAAGASGGAALFIGHLDFAVNWQDLKVTSLANRLSTASQQ